MTGEYLGYKPGVVEQAKLEYSPLSKVYNKGLEDGDNKERLLKRLKNAECKNKEQLKSIRKEGESQLKVIENKSSNVIGLLKNTPLKKD